MDKDLEFLTVLLEQRARQLRSAVVAANDGRGRRLVDLAYTALDRIDREIADVRVSEQQDDITRAHARRVLERLRQEQLVLHQLLGLYHDDVGRRDLPVGLLHLVDELVSDLLPVRADPVLHMSERNMYSTMDLAQAVENALAGTGSLFPEPHPVVFNLPALDPANGLLAPILAHEVGHTAARQGLDQQLLADPAFATAERTLRAVPSTTGVDPGLLVKRFDSWRQELLCDALAAALTGPSFLFASAVFLPATTQPSLPATASSHPYARDRIDFTLMLLDDLGWTPVLEQTAPGVLTWCQELVAERQLYGDDIETALRQAVKDIMPAVNRIATTHTETKRLRAEHYTKQRDLVRFVELGIPPVVDVGMPAGAWMILATVWLSELKRRGGDPLSLPEIAHDVEVNKYVVKSIELAGIHRLWNQR